MNTAFEMGQQHKRMGFSIYYNPFRHKGSAKNYTDWEFGWVKG